MRNFKLTLEYDGTGFSGWQTQAAGLRTVQSHLEEKVERIFKRKIHCHASGRTDSGAHAMGQVAHFKVDTPFDCSLIQKALNTFLDGDLTVLSIEEVPLEFNAQHSVKTKTYRYTILNRPQPSALWRNRAWFYPGKLNVAAMRAAAKHFIGKHDFKAFQNASGRLTPTDTVRTIHRLSISRQEDLIHISVTANGFLYKMVRNIVATLIAVGEGKMPAGAILELLKGKSRKKIPKTVPAWGLCLVDVQY